MALPKLDSFTAADQDLDVYNANWIAMTPIAGSTNELRIVSNRVETGLGGGSFGDCLSRWGGDGGQSAQCVVRVSVSYPGLAMRLGGDPSSVDAFGYFWLVGLGLVFRVEADGAETQIASGWTTASVDDTCYFQVDSPTGTTYSGKINGVSAGSVVDSSYAGGFFGLFNSGANNAAIDDFVGDSVPPTSSGPTVAQELPIFAQEASGQMVGLTYL